MAVPEAAGRQDELEAIQPYSMHVGPPINTWSSRAQAHITLAANCWRCAGLIEISGIDEQKTANDTITARARPTRGKEMGPWHT